MQRRLVVSYRRFGTTYRSHFKVLTLEGGSDIGCTETSVTTNMHCTTYQNSVDLIYTAAET
jgi:hypothetical protein